MGINITYIGFDPVEYLETEIIELMRRRRFVIKRATEEGKKRPAAGNTAKALHAEIIGMCKGLAAVKMQIEASKNDGNCVAIYESEVRADLEKRLNNIEKLKGAANV